MSWCLHLWFHFFFFDWMLSVCQCVVCDSEWDCGWTYDELGWLSLGMRKPLSSDGTVNSHLYQRMKKREIFLNMIKDIINILLVLYVDKTIYSGKYPNIFENKMVYLKFRGKHLKSGLGYRSNVSRSKWRRNSVNWVINCFLKELYRGTFQQDRGRNGLRNWNGTSSVSFWSSDFWKT